MHTISPCPYCFSSRITVTPFHAGFQILCLSCHATGPTQASKEQAKTSWNALTSELKRCRQNHADALKSTLEQISSLANSELQTN